MFAEESPLSSSYKTNTASNSQLNRKPSQKEHTLLISNSLQTMKIQILALVLTVFAVTVNANPKPGLFKSVLKFIKNYVNKKSSLESKRKDGKPAFCGKYDCPSFIVKNKTDDYELRCYQKAYWVSTIGYGTPVPMGGESSKMFMRLFRYIQGANKMEKEIPMTVPVLKEVKGEEYKKKLKMSFYLPKEFQDSPPKPKDSTVYLEEKEFCVYVRSFGGYPLFYGQYEKQFNELKDDLKKSGLQSSYVEGTELTTGYNEPWKLFGRRNEVMLLEA